MSVFIAFCAASTVSTASTITNFTTANCIATTPAAPSVSAITLSTATVSWTAVAGAVSYRVEYKQNVAAAWTTINTTSTSTSLSGLAPGTLHNVRIYSLCSATTISAVSIVTNFTTTTPCTDANEPNNSIAAPKIIAVNSMSTGSIAVSTDEDYYRITTTAPLTNVIVVLTQLSANFDLELYNASSVKVATSARLGTLNEAISYTSATATTYYIRVFGVSGAVHQNCYQLTVLADNSAMGCPSTSAPISNFGSFNNDADATPPSNNTGTMKLSLFPNPTRSLVNLKVSATDEGEYEVDFYDIVGKKVISRKSPLIKGENQLAVPTENLAKGTYMVRVFKGNESVIDKLIIE